jgi:hypothetical protein
MLTHGIKMRKGFIFFRTVTTGMAVTSTIQPMDIYTASTNPLSFIVFSQVDLSGSEHPAVQELFRGNVIFTLVPFPTFDSNSSFP